MTFSVLVSHKPASCRKLSVTVSTNRKEYSKTPKMDHLKSFTVPKYTIHDFEEAAESRVIKMILDLNGVPYEFKTVDREEYILEDYPYYALPMVEMNGRRFGSVLSICRHLAWRYNLSGSTAYEDALVDDVAEKVFEVRMKVKNWLDHIEHVPDHECDDTCTKAYAKKHLTSMLLPTLEAALRAKTTPWLVADKMTWLDLLVAALINPILFHAADILKPYPSLYLHNEKVAHHDQLKGALYRVRRRSFYEYK